MLKNDINISKDIIKIPSDFIKRSSAWIRNVWKLLHTDKKTSHHMRKLKKLLTKRRDLPVDSKEIERTEKVLSATIENDGNCVCEDCKERAAQATREKPTYCNGQQRPSSEYLG